MTPKPLLNRPKIQVRDLRYREAFLTLSSARTYNMSGPNPIAVSELKALMAIWGIASNEEMAKYLRLTQKLDQIYLKHCSEKSEAATRRS